MAIAFWAEIMGSGQIARDPAAGLCGSFSGSRAGAGG